MDSWKLFRHRLQLARKLLGRDWLVLVEAWWVLLFFYLALRWVQLDRLEDFTHHASENTPVSLNTLVWARHRQELVSLATRFHLLSMTCLPQALTLGWMLSRRAIPVQLRIGMNKTVKGLYAHAWVELQGEAIGEPEDITDRFKILQGDV